MALRVMTWNLWWLFGDWEQREPAILEVIRSQDPDVICLQEVWVRRDSGGVVSHQSARLADHLGMHQVANDPVWFGDSAFVNAVMSKWPLDRSLDAPLPRADGEPGHRRIVGAIVDTPWGRWPVASTHLDHRFDASATRERQVLRLMEHVHSLRGDPEVDLPVIVGADLNALPDSDEIRVATGRRAGAPPGIVLSDAWEQVGEGPGVTWSRDHPAVANSAWPQRRIDYVMISWPRPKPVGNPMRAWLAGDRAVAVNGEQVWPSDHAAVVAELQTPPSGG
jgi:endonuclease/exonuclease/phosphatase family metal-dependent hydrolase